MMQSFEMENHTNSAGNPSGGTVRGVGLSIDWQNGPLADEQSRTGRAEPNGAFVETVILAARRRIEYYQRTKFACDENATAIEHLNHALDALQARTARREAAGVEGTYGVTEGERAPDQQWEGSEATVEASGES